MDTHKPKTASINDFREWKDRNELVLQPRFQRRKVWNSKAKSFLIDTILRGFPIPAVYIRQKIDISTHKTIREVVDGQQRIGTILDFVDDKIRVMKIHNETYGELTFSDLPDDVKEDFLEYDLSVDFLVGASDSDVLDVFARINSYQINLNSQEKINAEFSGKFKQTVYDLGRVHLQFWRENRILTDNDIMRMKEADLSTDLVIAMISGIQDRRKFKSYYKQYDDEFPMSGEVTARFKKCIDIIAEIFGDGLRNSPFRSIGLFYSLFCVIYDLQYGLPPSLYPKHSLKSELYPRIRKALYQIEQELNATEPSRKYYEFVMASKKATVDRPKRLLRHEIILNVVLAEIESQ